MADSSQKFIARNRAPRVQIEYDVELYGSEKKVQLPFVMGVMSDLSGKSEVKPPAVEDRKFLEIDVDNFDERMKGMAPRVAFAVPNTLTGEGNVNVDLTFEKMSDFEPAAIARNVDHLRPLLEARTQLSNLMTYMDGKAGAESLIERLLEDPALLRALAQAPAEEAGGDAALDALRAVEVPEAPAGDGGAGVLDGLRAAAPAETAEEDDGAAALDGLRSVEVEEAAEDDGGTALDALRAVEVEDAAVDDGSAALDGLRSVEVEEIAGDDGGATLDALRNAEVLDVPAEDDGGALEALRAAEPEREAVGDSAADALASLEPVAEEVPAEDDLDAILGQMEAPEEDVQEDRTADVLSGLPEAAEAEEAGDDLDDILGQMEAPAEEAQADAAAALESLPEAAVAEEAGDDLDDILGQLEAPEAEAPTDSAAAALESLPEAPAAEEAADDLDDILGQMEAPEAAATPDDATAALDSLPEASEAEEASDDLDDILGGIETPETEAAPDDAAAALDGLPDVPAADEAGDELDEILGGVETPEAPASGEDTAGGDDLDALLSGLDAPEEAGAAAEDDLDGLLSDASEADALDDLLGDRGEPSAGDDPDALTAAQDDPAPEGGAADDLDALLSEDDAAADGGDDLDAMLSDDGADDLDALLAEDDAPAGDDLDDLLAESPAEAEGTDDLDALLADDGAGDELDALLSDDDAPSEETAEAAGADDHDNLLSDAPGAAGGPAEPELMFGQMTAERPTAERLNRKRFRIALLGDFTGRAARGLMETGDAMAAREPVQLDPDTVEEIIASFATTLVLPIGKDGAGVKVELKEFDDLHPDELYEKVELFSALRDLKGQLGHGTTAEKAAETLRGWAEAHGRPVSAPHPVSGGNTVRADLKLSDFQRLVGDREGRLSQPSPIDDLLARVVGPHIRRLPDPDVAAMQEAVDAALSGAMRLILHHPEFQSIEAQWRSLDLIARRIETDDTLDVMLYDISAEEIAADLTQADELSESGFVRLLTGAPLDEENGRGGYSALMGFYTFEETPPHAQLLGRIARVAAHVDAPFFAAITPQFIDTAKADRHPLVAQEWDRLRAMPEAGHLALATPRFLLRRPYGAKTEPIYEFDFEEFTQSEGLSGMLWANPVVLVSILLARSFKENGPSMGLGQIMSLNDMPYHYVLDRYGDQVALPCTERNLLLPKVETVLGRGFMPVVGIKGRDEVRLGSFQALGAAEVLGPWSGATPPPPSPPKPPAGGDGDTEELDETGLDDLLAGFDLDGDDGDLDLDLDLEAGEADTEDMDAELAALLDDL